MSSDFEWKKLLQRERVNFFLFLSLNSLVLLHMTNTVNNQKIQTFYSFEHVNYHKKEFWDELYSSSEPHKDNDWYMTYEHLTPILHPILRQDHKILIIGCGESGSEFSKKTEMK